MTSISIMEQAIGEDRQRVTEDTPATVCFQESITPQSSCTVNLTPTQLEGVVQRDGDRG